ncbi:hypothetical protein LINPERHAP1_LOCUS25017 [Linum perenne]
MSATVSALNHVVSGTGQPASESSGVLALGCGKLGRREEEKVEKKKENLLAHLAFESYKINPFFTNSNTSR